MDERELADAARLLGPARMVLDRCAEGVAEPGEAATMAQRIVDLIGHPISDEPPHAIVLIEQLAEAVFVAADYFTARDEMNAAVHTPSPVRLSPITVQVQEAVEAWRKWKFGVPASEGAEPATAQAAEVVGVVESHREELLHERQ